MINKLALRLKNEFPEFYQKILNIKQGRYNYTFNIDKYPYSFLANTFPNIYSGEKAPEIIYCFWTGDNPLTENRKKGLIALEKNAGIPVKLITPQNLDEYIKPEFPLHKGYEFLSLVHRSDYLRCYFMHHYGGGYADIKPFNYSWKSAFKKLNSSPKKYILGYPELLNGGLAPINHRFLNDQNLYEKYDSILNSEEILFKDLEKYTPLLVGNCAFICKPNTPITYEWNVELNKRMDVIFDFFVKNKLNNVEEIDYPIPYFHLLGQIFHPLQLKYHKYIIQDKNLLPILKDYR